MKSKLVAITIIVVSIGVNILYFRKNLQPMPKPKGWEIFLLGKDDEATVIKYSTENNMPLRSFPQTPINFEPLYDKDFETIISETLDQCKKKALAEIEIKHIANQNPAYRYSFYYCGLNCKLDEEVEQRILEDYSLGPGDSALLNDYRCEEIHGFKISN